MVELDEKIPEIIRESIYALETFDAVKSIKQVEINDYEIIVKVLWGVILPNKFQKKGMSDTGVMAEEEVYWSFPLSYPIRPPSPFLRESFSKNNPHINPYKSGELTNPCISNIPLVDLLHSEGFIALLSAMNDWLYNAAANNLHSPVQGWEPIVRDEKGLIFTEANKIKTSLEAKGVFAKYYKYDYSFIGNNNDLLIGNLQPISIGHANSTIKKTHFGVYTDSQKHFSIALFLQTKEVIDYYNIEKILNLDELKILLKSIGLIPGFRQRIEKIESELKARRDKDKKKLPREILIVIAIKRPFRLLGSSSNIELLAYRVIINENGEFNDSSEVIPVLLMQECNPEMLKKVSGVKSEKITKITMLGCGSLGSKMTLHLAKSGQYQFQLVDSRFMSAHNNARHGLILEATDSLLPLLDSKAKLLKNEVEKLGCSVSFNNKNILSIGEKKGLKIAKTSDFIIDTTASIPVRFFLNHHCKEIPARLIHTVMYGKAKMGVICVEGKNRSVRTDDVIAYMEMLSIKSEQVRTILFKSKDVDKHEFAEGCSSYTTVMKDTDISYLASGMSIQIDQYISKGTNEDGKLIVGLVDEQHNLLWESYDLPCTEVVERKNNDGWEVRIIGDVYQTIITQSEQFPGKENGGVLMGQICSFSKTIYITSLIDAPQGSLRTRNRFSLSTEKIIPLIKTISDKTNNKIKFLGTWHSHTAFEPPSELDKDTLEKLNSINDEPIVMLVCIDGKLVTVPNKGKPKSKVKTHA